jgi:hypothetical protein
VQNDKVRVAAAPRFQIVTAMPCVQIDITWFVLGIVKKIVAATQLVVTPKIFHDMYLELQIGKKE